MLNVYVCGPTVYDRTHIGNLKPILTYDLFIRARDFLGKQTNLIHNITDIDDKIIANALSLNVSETEVSQKYTAFYLKMLSLYNIKKPTYMPKVTENMPGIINFIQKLVDQGFAYTKKQNVYFDVTKIPTYGSLSKQVLANMHFEPHPDKKHPADFALWKTTTQGIKFDSPWGPGRPGWHTECAYFVDHYLKGQSLDLHGGGQDLIFPHHENENAQYLAQNKTPIALHFKHTGLINFAGEKMSKSLGNIIFADDFAQKYDPNVLRYIFMTASQSAPLNLTPTFLKQAVAQVKKLGTVYSQAQRLKAKELTPTVADQQIMEYFAGWDFAQGQKAIWALVKQFHILPSAQLATSLTVILTALGFNFKSIKITKSDHELLNKWEKLRASKKYEAADALRKILQTKGLI